MAVDEIARVGSNNLPEASSPSSYSRSDPPSSSRTAGCSEKVLRFKICRDIWGTWSVQGLSPLPVAHLPSLSASLDYARRECAGASAIIELEIDGFYVVVHQEDGWPRLPLALSGCLVTDHAHIASSYRDAGSVARWPSWFVECRDAAMRLIASLAFGLAVMKRSKSAFWSTSSRQ
jgi:hypothetical protein